jgi:pimeloyl-ACP methyl ester carboxylesterase
MVKPVVVQAGPIKLSGLEARAQSAAVKGLIVALHGGSMSAGYWHVTAAPGLSLLELGAGLGFHVLALDRPGYGLSHGHQPTTLGLERQAELLFQAIDRWCTDNSHGGPVFLIGHSIGGILTLNMAAHPRGGRLSGVDVCGVPFRFAGQGGQEVGAWPTDLSHLNPLDGDDEARRRLLFGPPGTYEPAVFEADRGLVRPMPLADYRDGMAASQTWPQVMPMVRLPVQFTTAEFEAIQETGWEVLRDAGAQLCNSRHMRLELQKGAAHSISAHKVGRAYHLRALAFFEECLALG